MYDILCGLVLCGRKFKESARSSLDLGVSNRTKSEVEDAKLLKRDETTCASSESSENLMKNENAIDLPRDTVISENLEC